LYTDKKIKNPQKAWIPRMERVLLKSPKEEIPFISLVFSALLSTSKRLPLCQFNQIIEKMKKLVYLAIAGLSFGAFSACSSGESQNTEEPTLEAEPEEESDAGFEE
jgi:hypothetical protein